MLFLLLPAAFAATTQLTKIQLSTVNSETHIILELNQAATYKVFTLANPDRVIVDLTNTQLATSLKNLSLNSTPITQVREGRPTPNVLRLVFDVNQVQHPKVSQVTNATQSTVKLLIDFSHPKKSGNNNLQQTQNWVENEINNSSTTTLASAPIKTVQQKENENNAVENKTQNATNSLKNNSSNISQTPAANQPQSNNANTSDTSTDEDATELAKPIVATLKNNNSRRPIVVVIDPGHGGKDPGTIGSMGIQEKNVVLAISQYLYQILRKDPCFKPALTRTGDYFIPLRKRLAIARRDKGELFIAIHADAYSDPFATGAAVFALSAHGASSEAARWLAEKENYSELGSVSLMDKSDMVRSVLIDLSQTATIASSLQVGQSLMQQIGKVGSLHYQRVEQAPFMVLKNPDIPSLLIETGFLSNPGEQQRLSDPYYQQKLAQAIYAGIKAYFWDNPPPGTLILAMKKTY